MALYTVNDPLASGARLSENLAHFHNYLPKAIPTPPTQTRLQWRSKRHSNPTGSTLGHATFSSWLCLGYVPTQPSSHNHLLPKTSRSGMAVRRRLNEMESSSKYKSKQSNPPLPPNARQPVYTHHQPIKQSNRQNQAKALPAIKPHQSPSPSPGTTLPSYIWLWNSGRVGIPRRYLEPEYWREG